MPAEWWLLKLALMEIFGLMLKRQWNVHPTELITFVFICGGFCVERC
jgi:hypothetical protein